MKQLLTIILTLLGSVIYSQLDIKCNYTQYCKYDKAAKEFNNCYDRKEESVFKFNEDGNVITHFIGDKYKYYYITDIESNENEGRFIYYVDTSSGDKYIIQITLDEAMLRIIKEQSSISNNVFILRYYIYDIVSK